MKRMNIHKILLTLPILALAACSEKDQDMTHPLTGEDKTPLTVTALLDAGGNVAKTRAADKDFANGDKLLAYLRHVTATATTTDGKTTYSAIQSVTADQAPRLVTFTKGSTVMAAYNGSDITPIGTGVALGITSDNTKQATDLTTSPLLYWDDFSNSTSTDTDLRTEGHYLQSYYGYCYNGGAPTSGTELDTDDKKAIGTIGWTIQTDQTTDANMQHSDLLWSAEQTPVSYTHSEANIDAQRPGLIIPYTHAMSKVTINVKAGIGFANDFAFTGTALTLNSVRTTCTATAPTATLAYPTDGTGKDNVTMKPGTGTGTRSFEAIIVPSILTVGNTFATITGMDGNKYNIPVTEDIVKVAGGWGAQLTNATEDVNHGTAQVKPRTRAGEAQVPSGKGHQMKSGVHYLLNVTINNTEVNVSALIVDWDEVEAEGVGEIHFTHDIHDKGNIAGNLKENGFDVYKSASTTFGAKATTLSWIKASNVWKYKPVIYWQGGTPEYFRALSNVRADIPSSPANESLSMENELDALWGTTQAHSGTYADATPYNFAEGAALNPRTGDVPLQFYHAMSKITFNLVDANKYDTNPLAKLNLSNATIQLTDLATGGTLNLYTGNITPSSITPGQKTFSEDQGSVPSRMGYFAAMENGAATSYAPDYTLKDYVITPQEIGDAATVIVTLADGSVYKAQLNRCTIDLTDTPVTQWERGKHYTYTITLAKEKITFRAMIQDWEPISGSGNATLEWD